MKKDRGFVGIIVIGLLALVALKYFFDFSIFAWARTSEGRGALIYLKDLLIWLKGAILALWGYIH